MKYTATTFTPIYNSCRKFALSIFLLLCATALTQRTLAQCTTASLPYNEGFESIAVAGNLPSCTYGSTGVGTSITNVPSWGVAHIGNNYLHIPFTFSFFQNIFLTRGFQLTAGNTYNFSFWYTTTTANWKVNACFDTLPANNSVNGFYTAPQQFTLSNLYNPVYARAAGSFTCQVSGIYYLGIWGDNTVTYSGELHVDDINIDVATPVAATPTINIQGPSSFCTNNSTNNKFNLYDSSNLFHNGVHYQWQSSPAGANTFVDIADTLNYLNTSIVTSTDYRIIATNMATNQMDTSAIHNVAVAPFYKCYCQPSTGVNIGGGGIYPLIDSVKILNTSLQSQTYAALPNAYMAYPATGNTTTTLYRGSYYTLNALMNTLGANAEAWIDYNHNGTFDPAEYIGMGNSFLSFISTGSFLVPTTAQTGLTGLRVRSGGNASSSDACTGPFASGETEDYIINLLPAPYNDLGTQSVVQPAVGSSVCANSTFTVSALIYNPGSLPQSNFVVGATYPGNPTPIYGVYNGTLAPGASTSFVIGNMSIPVGGTYGIKVYTALSNDQNRANDTSYSSFIVTPLPADPIVHSDTVCPGGTANPYVVAVPGSTYNWYNAPSGGTVVFSGTSQSFPNITNNTTYFVSASTPGVANIQNGGTSGVPQTLGCTGGIMFNVSPSTNLTIDGFNLHFNDTGLQPVSVYYRIGTYQGFQTNPGAWYLLGSSAVNVSNTSNSYYVTVNNPLNLTNGSNYALYLVYDAQNTPVTWPTNSSFPGADLSISVNGPLTAAPYNQGAALCGFFSNVNNVNQFNFFGSIAYHLGGANCESNRVPISAAVGPQPVVNLGPNDTVCYTPNLYLDAGNPGAIYTWSTGDTTQRIHITQSGTYSVTVFKYCNSTTVSKTVIVLPMPTVVGINYVRSNQVTYAFSASGVQNVNGYYWNFGDGNGSNLPNPIHTYANNYPYHVKLIVYNDCGSDTLNWAIPTGVTNVNKTDGDISVYPNPANTSITVSAIDNLDLKQFVIINAIGAEVYKSTATNSKTENIDISKLPAGNYILRAGTTNGTINKLFTVLHQ